MKKDLLEIKLMELEVRLDRMQNEARKALGIVRALLEYHNPPQAEDFKVLWSLALLESASSKIPWQPEIPQLFWAQ